MYQIFEARPGILTVHRPISSPVRQKSSDLDQAQEPQVTAEIADRGLDKTSNNELILNAKVSSNREGQINF